MCSLKEIYFIHINKIKGYLLIGFSRVMETSQSVCVIRIKRLFTGLYFALCFFLQPASAQTFFTHGHTSVRGLFMLSLHDCINNFKF